MKTSTIFVSLACTLSVLGAPALKDAIKREPVEADSLYRGGSWGKRDATPVEADSLYALSADL